MSYAANRTQTLWLDWAKDYDCGWQKFAAMLNHCRPFSIGEEAVMADLHKSAGQHMQKEPADKFYGWQRHFFDLVAVLGISPAKADTSVL